MIVLRTVIFGTCGDLVRGLLCTSRGWLMGCCGVGGVVMVDWWVRGFVGWLLSLSIVYRLLGVGVVWMG